MTTHCKTTGRLTTQYCVGLIDLRRDIFKAYRHFIANLAKGFCYHIQHMSGRQISNYRTFPTFILMQIIIQHAKDLVGVDIPTVGVDDAQPVSIAVGGNADIRVALGDDGHAWGSYIGGSGKRRYIALGTMELAR